MSSNKLKSHLTESFETLKVRMLALKRQRMNPSIFTPFLFLFLPELLLFQKLTIGHFISMQQGNAAKYKVRLGDWGLLMSTFNEKKNPKDT